MNKFPVGETKLEAFCHDGSLTLQNGFACGDWNEEGKGILQIRPFNVTNVGSIELNARKYVETDREIDPYLLRRRDVIFNNTNSEELVGKTALWNREERAVLSNHMTILRVLREDRLNPEFLSYYLLQRWFDRYFHSVCRRHVNQASVSTERLRSTGLPDFEVSEQRKIAAVLGLVQQAIEQQEQMITLTTELKRALLHKLFTEGLRDEPQKMTEIGPVPASWEVARLGDIATLKSGGTPSRTRPEYWVNGTIPWVKTGEIDYCEINGTSEKITAAGLANSSAKMFPAGTLVMAMYGQGITRGKVAILGLGAATNQACVAIFPGDDLRTKFLYYFFENKYEHIRNLAHGANQKNLSAEILKGLTVVYPKSHDVQDILVAALEALDLKLSVTRKRKVALTDLFRTLLHQLMTAQIRVHDLDLSELEKMGIDQ